MTPRQKEILAAIIRDFMESAEPVASAAIVEKHDLGVSPATVRNEMIELSRQGYISKSHSSAGRYPTTLGMRFYINSVMEDEEVPHLMELEISRRIFENRFAKERLVKKSVDVLSEVSRNLSIALINDAVFYSGMSDMVRYPEFQNIEKLREILVMLENHQIMESLFSRYKGASDSRRVKVLIGEETGISSFGSCGVIFSDFKVQHGEQGIIGIVGPARMDYQKLVPVVGLVADKLNNAVFGW